MPGIRDLRKVSSDIASVNKLQENLQEFVRPIISSAIIDGQLLTGVNLVSSAANNVEHKLGRELLGYIVCGKSATSDIWDSQATNLLKTKTLILNSSANVTISLWVF